MAGFEGERGDRPWPNVGEGWGGDQERVQISGGSTWTEEGDSDGS